MAERNHVHPKVADALLAARPEKKPTAIPVSSELPQYVH